MLNINQQYGVAASSSIVRVVHPEDVQANEVIQRRNRMLPPKLNTIRAPHFDHTSWNHSRPMTQVARRGTRNPRLSRPHVETFPNSTDVPINLPTETATQSSTALPPDRSISPKLPPSPIRRRMPQDPPRPIDLQRHHHHHQHRPSSPPPLPSRQRKQRDFPVSELPSSRKLKTHNELSIKREAHSIEPALPSRKLVTEACTFWSSPENCKKSAPEYSQSRRGFAKAKVSELARYGLRTTRTFFRDDGLVIDWRSDIPVWNDTFLPERPTTVATNSKRKRNDIDADASNPSQRPRRFYKRQKEMSHWSTGLSMAEIRKLGRDVEANLSNHSPQPPLSGQPPSSQDINRNSSDLPSLPTTVTSPKRTVLPTRLTASERNEISNSFSQKASSSPLRHGQMATKTITVSADTNSPKLTTSSNADRQNSPNSPADNNFDPSVARLLADAFGSVKETCKLTDPNNATSVDLPGSSNVESVFPGAENGRPIEELLRRGGSGEVHDAPTQISCTNPQHTERAGVGEAAYADVPEYEMAEDFLRRFIHDFDTDRNNLRSAYSNDALLSCRSVPSVTPSVNSDSASVFPSPSTHFGGAEIMNQLNKFTNCHFSMPSNAIYYDVAVLSQEVITLRALNRSIDKNAVGGILATLHSQIIRENEGLEQTMSLHQSFVLRRRTEADEADKGDVIDVSTGEGGSSTSLIIVSHHMILRDEPLLRPDQVGQLALSFTAQDLPSVANM